MYKSEESCANDFTTTHAMSLYSLCLNNKINLFQILSQKFFNETRRKK